MSDEKKETTQDSNDPKAKFREALEKKKQGNSLQGKSIQTGPKISGGQSGGSTPKMFRRKSGSA